MLPLMKLHKLDLGLLYRIETKPYRNSVDTILKGDYAYMGTYF
jgi:hypothetical protein